MDKISTKIAGKIAGSLEKRLKKAYPKARKIEEEIREENEEKVFAKGCGFYKIVMLFMIGAFLGDITETDFLSCDGWSMDEQKQCGLGTVQHCLGACNCACHSTFVQI